MYRAKFYVSPKTRCYIKEFLGDVPLKVEQKIRALIEILEHKGPNLPRPYADIVRGKIRELRIIFGSTQYRILYFFHGRKIILTHGFIKKTDKVPEEEIARAKHIMADYLSR